MTTSSLVPVNLLIFDTSQIERGTYERTEKSIMFGYGKVN
uniref:Uncharacterized protein n=1 Tax=Lepeophtheirus salmonis TaxID=72036 RepID=A0A0K2T1A8_LEPSM